MAVVLPSRHSFFGLTGFARAGALAFGLASLAAIAVGCGANTGPAPRVIPNTTLPEGGGAGGGGGGGGDGGASDGGFDAGADAGGQACDGGCLQFGQACQPDVINGGCEPGLSCLIDINNGVTYTCQGPSGDL